MPKIPAAVLTPGAFAKLDDFPVRVSWSPDSAQFALAGGEGGVFLGLLGTDTLKLNRVGEHGMGAMDVAWRPGHSQFASCGQDNSLACWDAVNGRQLWRTPRGKQWVERIAWRADGVLLASAAARQLSLWNDAGAAVHAFDALPASVNALSWSRDSRDLAAASHGGIALLRVDNGRYDYRLLTLSETCLTAEFSRNGKVIVTGTAEGSVHFWYLLNSRDSQMRGYGGKVEHTLFTADSRYLVTAAANELVIWDFGGRGPEGTNPQQYRGHTERIVAIAVQSNGNYAATVGKDWRLSLWLPGKATLALDAHLAESEPAFLSWSPDGRKLLLAEKSGQVSIYHLSAPGKGV
jgi:WD40 repeat protein